jgi:hypothetical protein
MSSVYQHASELAIYLVESIHLFDSAAQIDYNTTKSQRAICYYRSKSM